MNEEPTTIGAKLKQARINKGVSLEEVYQKTKIHINILSAIEDDRLRDFSSVYIKGFLKIYTKYLGLNVQEIIQQYQELFTAQDESILKQETKSKIQLNLFKSKINLGLRVFVIICIVFVFIRLVSVLKNRKKIAPQITKTEAVKEQKATTSAIKKTGPIKLAIKAKEDCWIQLYSDGKKIFEGILKKGMKESWSAKSEIKLSVGNAGGIELEVNDKILSSLGRSGQVLKNIIITSEGISTIGSKSR